MNTKSNKIFSILMLLAGSLLVGFSMGRWLAPLAAWIGPVLIMRYSRDHKIGIGYPMVIAAYFLAMFIGFGEIWAVQLSSFAPFLVVGIGFLWSLPYLADRLVSPRLRGFSSTLVFPLAVTTLEFVNVRANPLGAWGATGFTQYGDLPLMQLASVTGMIGITLLMGWFASVVNWIWENRDRSAEIFRGLMTFGTVLALVYIFGFVRLNLAPLSKTDETVRVAGIFASPQVADPFNPQAVQSHWEAYFSETVREAQAGAQVIVWPEGAGGVSGPEEESYIAQAQEVARQNDIYLAIGFATFYPPETGQPLENKLLVFDPTGKIVIENIKYGGNLIEGFLRGNGILQTAATPVGILSGVICWDMDFPTVIQQTGQNGTGLMLVPSVDSIEIDPVHSQMAVFRAIENGMSLVRQAEGSLSIATDPYGRVLAQRTSSVPPTGRWSPRFL